MSIEAMSQCWGDDFPVKADGVGAAVVRLTALAIADVVNDFHGNLFYGALPNLALKVGASRETVRLAVNHLVVSGVLSIVSQRPGRVVEYRWNGPTRNPGGSVEQPTRNLGGYPPDRPAGTHLDVQGGPTRTSRADTNLIPTRDSTTNATAPLGGEATFDAFWRIYPSHRRVHRNGSFAKWNMATIRDGIDARTILDGLDAWVRYWTARGEPEFVPMSTTWMNQRRWETPPPPLGTSTGGRNAGFYGDRDLLAVDAMPVGESTSMLRPFGRRDDV